MIKYSTEVIKTEQTTAEFYCDKCGKLIGESVEWADGYIPPKGEYQIKFGLEETKRWIRVEKHLCKECREEIENKIAEFFVELAEGMGGEEE